jgi:Nucleotidyl transferase AbiEii toxin, Type IV TA system
MTSRAAVSSPQAFRRSLSDRIKREAKDRGRNPQQLQRQFLMQRLLARVFAEPAGPWVLKGGTGLLIRIPGARHSQDIDLLHADSGIDSAIEDLRRQVSVDAGDPLTFVLGTPTSMTGGVTGVKIPVEVFLGATVFERFSIDVSSELHTVARVERMSPVHVIEIPGLPQLPEFVLYPLPDQIADKICAMYERHGEQERPSTRFRDLVDLLLITTNLALDARAILNALASESQRRRLTLPSMMIAPGAEWDRGYRETARGSSLPSDLHALPAALERVGSCMNPLLSGTIAAGTWQPDTTAWEGGPE